MPGIDPITGKTIYSSPLQPKPPGDVQTTGTLQAPITGLATRMQQPSPIGSLLEKGTAIPTGTFPGTTAPAPTTGYGDIGYTPGGYTERQKFLGEGSMLPKFGYGGELGVNPYETQALDYITKMAETRQPLQTTMPAESFYREALAGEYSPLGDLFRKGVYETTEAGAMETLEKLQKGMGERFAHKGG
ncbi:unnamed protein product, partial [marine sediment metagenome]